MLQYLPSYKEFVIYDEILKFSRYDWPEIRRRPERNNNRGDSFMKKKIINGSNNY